MVLRSLVGRASRFLNELHRFWWRHRLPDLDTDSAPILLEKSPQYERLQRLLLTDEVNRTILEEFAAHRKGARGREETGWVLLGRREASQATVLATLPAGADRDAGVSHVRFNSDGQALAGRIVRQWDRSLTMLGVLHTHPGSLRHPSTGDFAGDSQWVGRLRGREGIFGIGTADAPSSNGNGALIAHQPQPHVQCMGELCLSWYSLSEGDRGYRPLSVGLTLGPDLARRLRPLWHVVEAYAEQLDRLCVQQTGVQFGVVSDLDEPALSVNLKLADPRERLRVLLNQHEVRYYLIRQDDLIEVDPKEPRLDRAVYLILAELAG